MKQFKDYIKEELDTIFLTDGLISSYDVSKLVSHIKNLLPKKIQNITYTDLPEALQKTSYGNIFTVFVKLNNELDTDENIQLDKILSLFGYTNSTRLINQTELQLEPKYPVKMNSIIEKSNDHELFHITQKKYMGKIETNGLIPKISQTTFDHPANRIYLLWVPERDSNYKNQVLDSFTNILARDKQLTPGDMTVLRIDFDPMKTYYIDDTTLVLQRGVIGLFTTENIHPIDINSKEL